MENENDNTAKVGFLFKKGAILFNKLDDINNNSIAIKRECVSFENKNKTTLAVRASSFAKKHLIFFNTIMSLS